MLDLHRGVGTGGQVKRKGAIGLDTGSRHHALDIDHFKLGIADSFALIGRGKAASIMVVGA
jgi:hypothetical protein